MLQQGAIYRPRTKPAPQPPARSDTESVQTAAENAPPATPKTTTAGDGTLLTPAEAASLLSVTEKVLERWRSTGDGPTYVRLTRKTIRYRTSDINAFISGNVRANTAG
jgi:hypothetical protein